MYYPTGGNIREQVGASLGEIRRCVTLGDVLGIADHLTLLVALSAPKLTPEELRKLQVPSLEPGKDRHGDKSRKLFQECMRILRDLLIILSDKGLYAYKDVPTGDASGLADLLLVPEE